MQSDIAPEKGHETGQAGVDYSTRRVYQPRSITIGRAMGYGVVDLMGGGWNTIVSGLMLYFFTTYGDVTVVESGSILLIARVVDAVVSLLIGPASDNFYRTRLGKKFGRRHFFLLVGAPLMFFIFPLLWIPGRGYWYYLVVYLLVEIIIALVLIPWETLPTEMTPDYTQRTKLSSTRMFLSATGTTLVFALPAWVKAQFPDWPWGFTIVGATFAVLFGAAILITYFTTWERALTPEVVAELDRQPKMSVGRTLSHTWNEAITTFKNHTFNRHLAIYLLSFTAKDMYATALTFFIVYSMGLDESFGFTLGALAAIGIPVTVVTGFVMVKKGPKFLWNLAFSTMIAMLLASGAVYLAGVSGTSAVVWLIIINLIYQCGRATLEFTPWNVYPFIPDIDYIMSREHRAGAYAAVMTFGRKSTGAVATFIVSWLMGLAGFIGPNDAGVKQAQTVATQHWIAVILVFAPMALLLIALYLVRRFDLNSHTHDILREEIKRLEEGGSKADVTPEAKAVVEDLTGHKYAELWPDVPWSKQL